jgi:hypothetical protein
MKRNMGFPFGRLRLGLPKALGAALRRRKVEPLGGVFATSFSVEGRSEGGAGPLLRRPECPKLNIPAEDRRAVEIFVRPIESHSRSTRARVATGSFQTMSCCTAAEEIAARRGDPDAVQLKRARFWNDGDRAAAVGRWETTDKTIDAKREREQRVIHILSNRESQAGYRDARGDDRGNGWARTAPTDFNFPCPKDF